LQRGQKNGGEKTWVLSWGGAGAKGGIFFPCGFFCLSRQEGGGGLFPRKILVFFPPFFIRFLFSWFFRGGGGRDNFPNPNFFLKKKGLNPFSFSVKGGREKKRGGEFLVGGEKNPLISLLVFPFSGKEKGNGGFSFNKFLWELGGGPSFPLS